MTSTAPTASVGEAPGLARGPAFSVVLLYAIGEVPITITMVLMGLLGLFFYNSVMGLSGALTGIGLSAGLVVDALLDPYIGYRSDVSASRFGRRHLFMFAGAVAMGPCFYLLFSPPRGLPPAATFALLLGFSILFRAVSAVYRIPYLSLGAELTSGYHERTRVIAVRAFLGLLGTLAAASLSFLLFFPTTGAGPDPKLDHTNYRRLALFFGSVMTLAGLAATWGTRMYRDSAAAEAARHSLGRFFRGFSIAFRNRAFRGLWVSSTVFFFAVVVNASLAVHYFTWYVRVTDSKAISSIQTAFYLGAVGGVFLWARLARRVEKWVIYVACMSGTALALACGSLLMGEGRLFGTGAVTLLVAGHAMAGVFASSLWVLPASMLADVADEDALETGQRREGIFFGILNFGEKVAAGLGLGVSGALLHYLVRLVPNSSVQDPVAIERLGLLYGLLPGVLVLAAAVPVFGFSLTAPRVAEIQSRLGGMAPGSQGGRE